MPSLTMLPTLLREVCSKDQFPWEPEPDLIMDDEEQVAAYAHAGRIDGVMSAAYLFQTSRISQVIHGCKDVVDLGCGPATQLGQVAEFNPQSSFLGVDLSDEMLSDAKTHVEGLKLDNVRFQKDDISSLASLDDNCADAVISTMAIHHLPSEQHLASCFKNIARILKPGGALYLTDFGRLKSLKSVLFFAYANRKNQPHLFSRDYERSLRAAFQTADFADNAEQQFPADVSHYRTFGIPILQILKTGDKAIPESQKLAFRDIRKKLPGEYRSELDDIRMLFRFSGLNNDPF